MTSAIEALVNIISISLVLFPEGPLSPLGFFPAEFRAVIAVLIALLAAGI